MNRRELLAGLSVGPMIANFTERLRATTNPLARIAVSTWSLHAYFKATKRNVPGTPPQGSSDLTLLDFFQLVKDRWGVTQYETVSTHYDSTDPAYLAQARAALDKVNGKIRNMPCDIPRTNLSDDDDEHRIASVDAVKKWIDVAVVMGSPSIRCNTGRSRANPKNIDGTVNSYRELAEYGAGKNVRVTIENHEGVSTDMALLEQLLKTVNHPNLGTCPDFGNTFKTEEQRHAGLTMMFPYAKICHAKTLEFNATGEMTSFDFPGCIALAEKAGFTCVYSIEFEGSGDPMQGVAWTLAMLKKALT
jgi:sugar phosphate isomerase/epimerase